MSADINNVRLDEVEISERSELGELAERQRRYLSIIKDNPWGFSPRGQTAVQAARRALATKTGMYAKIPLVCKGDTCPYADSCSLLPYGLAPEGDYCPVEVAQVEALVQGYYHDFEIDELSFADKSLINEIVFLDIMLERCKALLAKEGTPVSDIVIGMSEAGEEIQQPAVSKAWEAYEKMTKRKDQKLQLLAATRNMRLKLEPDTGDRDSVVELIMNNITGDDIVESESAKSNRRLLNNVDISEAQLAQVSTSERAIADVTDADYAQQLKSAKQRRQKQRKMARSSQDSLIDTDKQEMLDP